MSRRKQAKPQHVQSNALHLDNMDGDCVSVGAPGPHACGRCCEEFAARSDLEEHERNCSPNPVVVIVNENDDLSFLSHHGFFAAASSAGTAGREAEGANNSVTTESSVLEDAMDCSKSTGCHGDFNGTCYTRGCPAKTDTDFCATDFSPSLLQSGSSSEQEQDFLWMDGNVIIENLESTKVAVAQFLQQTPPGVRQNGNHKRSVSSLLEQLLALQMQQIHQLRLIDQIRHQVLVLAAQRAETPGTAAGCGRDLSSSKSIDRLTELSSNLSKQLAVAAGAAQCLAYQSANMGDFRKITTAERQRPSYLDGERVFSSDPLRSLGKLVTSAIHNQLSKTQYMYSGGPHPQLNVLSQTKISSLAISTDSFINKSTNNLHFIQPQSTSKLQMNYNQMLKIGAVVEDLDALAALAQKRKCDAAGLTETKISSKDAFFKHKCRFCAKLFGSDSALKIHLRSHTGERPYKCNICANRFSTRGNLKVHFQRHKQRYPHIQMNPYPVPEHLDNVPTSTGIPYGMSMQPEKIVTRWIHSKPPQTAITASSSSVLLGSTKQHALIKREAHSDLASAPCNQGLLHFDPTIKPKNTGHPAGTGHDSMTAMNRKNEEKTSLSVVFKMMTTKLEESKERSPDDVLFRHANSDSAQGIQRLKSSETSKLQQLVEQIDGKGSDANECVVCRRSLSCRSALRMHYRTHTGERPYPCKLCGRAFSTKGNLKTHQAVHPAALPPGAQRSCPICQRKFTDAPALQQHVRLHLVGRISRAAGSSEDAPRPAKRSEGFTDNENSIELMDFDDDDEDEEDDEGDDEGSGECGPSQFESLPSSLSSSVSDMSFSEAPDATSCCQRNEGLRYNFIKIERENRATGEGCLTYNPTSAEDRYGGEPAFSEGLAPERSFSTHSLSLYDLNSEKPFPAQASAAPSQLRERCTAPSDLKLYNPKDPPSPVHCFREKGTFRHTACDICGKNFACQSALDIHYRSHTKERPFICTACNRGFTTKGNLKQHMLTHQMRDLPSQLFEAAHPNRAPNAACSVLSLGPSAFKAEASAHPHTPAGNGRVPSVISWSSSFPAAAAAAAAAAYSSSSSSPSSAAVPARRAAKQHRCRTCGKTFSSSSALQIHDRTHTGEKPFACTVCRRAFTTKGNLKVHMGTHMWNSAPSRRGRRLCVDGPPVPVGSSSAARLPAPPHRKPATTSRPDDSVLGWAPRAGPLSGPPNADDTLVTHSREVPYFFGRTGPGAQHPAEERGVGPGEARHTDRPDSLAAGGRDRNERGV